MRTILAIAYLFVAAVASATTYYIDYEAGDDTQSGATTGTAWKHLPFDARATGVADATSIVAGDLLAVRRGTTYVVSTALSYPAGAVGNRIVVDGDVWGTGDKAIFTGDNQAVTCFTDSNTVRSNATFQNLTIQDFAGYKTDSPIYDGVTISGVDIGTDTFTTSTDHSLVVGDDVQFTATGGLLPTPLVGGTGSTTLYYVKTTPTTTTFTISSTNGGATYNITGTGSGTIKVWEPITAPANGTGFNIEGSSHNLSFINIDFIRIGQWRNVPPMSGTNSVTGFGIYARSNENILIQNCTFKRMAKGVGFYAYPAYGPLKDITIDGCSFSEYIVWGIDIGIGAANGVVENLEIKNSKVFDMHEFDFGNWQGFGEKPHTDGIFLRTTALASTWTNVRIHGCEFYADVKGNSIGGTASIYISQGPSVLIYNNIFDAPAHTRMIGVEHYSVDPQVVRVYNNTFLNSPTHLSMATEWRTAYRTVHWANNISVGTWTPANQILIHDNTQTPTTDIYAPPGTYAVRPLLENNLYFHTTYSAAATKLFQVDTVTYANLADIKARGFESGSVFGNPLLKDLAGTFINKDYRLSAGSAAIGMGQNLSAYFTTDKDGNARPAVGAWDVGAHQYDASPPADVTAPTLGTAAIDSTGLTLTLTYSEPVVDVAAAHYTLTGGHSLTLTEADGATAFFAISPPVVSGEVVTLAYTSGAGRTADAAGNLLATFSGAAVTNDSLETTPDPPRAAGRGAAARRVRR